MEYFDYESVAREAGMSKEDLDRVCSHVRREFPRDEMMFELHVMRACRVVRDGPYTLEQVLADPEPAPAPKG